MRNIDAAPAADDVAQYLAAVRAAPLAAFLKLNPEADHNHDGVLTVEERDRFIERHMTAARQKVLERFPEADANGDGLLTNDEMREFFRGRARSKVRTRIAPGGEDSETITLTGENASGESEVRVIRLQPAEEE
ncbi:MAG: hypothetical protein D6744_03200 [Planctomycetota bacterium]|nr:MAG: hypothetical protein D6744_03200 [Planctomycetota bacterium]